MRLLPQKRQAFSGTPWIFIPENAECLDKTRSGAHKHCASERRSQEPIKTPAVLIESEVTLGTKLLVKQEKAR